MRWLTIRVAAVVLLATVGQATAQITIDSDTTIDYYVDDDAGPLYVVEGASPPTTVDIVSPADINSPVRVFDSSILNMFGGTLGYNVLGAFDSSTANIFGGTIYRGESYGSSTVNLSGGDGSLRWECYDSSTINVSAGGFIDDLETLGSNTVTMSGGQIGFFTARGTTAVNMSGGLIEDIEAHNGTVVEMSAGEILQLQTYGTEVTLFDGVIGRDLRANESTVRMFDGYVHYMDLDDFSRLEMFDGEVDEMKVYDSSVAHIWGGKVLGNFIVSDSSTDDDRKLFGELDAPKSGSTTSIAMIYGGQFDGNLRAAGFSEVHIFGGQFHRDIMGREFRAFDSSVITIRGSEFNYDYGEIPDSSGTLTGILTNGDLIDVQFDVYEDASIVLVVPEPATLALLCMGALALLLYASRERRRTT